MTEAVTLTVVGGVVTIITVGLNTLVQNWKINAVRAEVKGQLDDQTVQATVVETKIDEVHTVVNSKADVAAKRIESLEGQVAVLVGALQGLSKSVKIANGIHEKPEK